MPDGRPHLLVGSRLPEFHPSYAPDGDRVAFDRDVSGNYDVYVFSRKTKKTTRLTRSPEEDSTPAWSPDGAGVAFVSARDGNYEIYLIGANGKREVNLTRNPKADDVAPAWRPGAKTPKVRALAMLRHTLASCSIVGSTGPDSLSGGTGKDTICGGLGNDYLNGMEEKQRRTVRRPGHRHPRGRHRGRDALRRQRERRDNGCVDLRRRRPGQTGGR